MTGSVEDFDGLCGIIHLNATSDLQVRCLYEFGHGGKHSWEDVQVGLHIEGGTGDVGGRDRLLKEKL